MSLLVVAELIGIAWVVFGVTVYPGPFAIRRIVVSTIVFGGLRIVIGSVIDQSGFAISLGGTSAFPFMFISGICWKLASMSQSLQQIVEVSPVIHYHQSLQELMILDSMEGVWLRFGMMRLLATIFVGLAVHLTAWGEVD